MMPSGDSTPLVIDDLRNHKDDFTWLTVHADTIYKEIKRGLDYAHTAQTAIEMLILAMPYVTTQVEHERWESLLGEALRHTMILADNEALIQLWASLGEIHLHSARYQSASKAFEIAFRRATSSTETEAILMARIGMLRTKIIYSKQDIDVFIDDSLAIAQEVNDRSLIGRLHYTLAVAYTHQAKTQKALGHGQVALGYTYHNRVERNRALLILAEACRASNLFDRAAWYLEQIMPAYDHSYDDALLAYARGATLVELLRPAEALQWLEFARTQFSTLGRHYMTGATHQTIALAQIDLEQFEPAHTNIRRALSTWKQIENQHQKAEAIYTLGYLHHQKNETDTARAMYAYALKIAATLVASPMVEALKARIHEDLNTLNLPHE